MFTFLHIADISMLYSIITHKRHNNNTIIRQQIKHTHFLLDDTGVLIESFRNGRHFPIFNTFNSVL